MRITSIAHSLAVMALACAAQFASAQTMYRVVRLALTGSEPLSINSQGKILLWSSNGSYYVCGRDTCRSLPRVRDGSANWTDFNDQGMLVGEATKPTGGRWVVRKDPQQGGGARFLTLGYSKAIAPDGAVIGMAQDDHAFLYTDHSIELKGLVGSPEPTDINSHRVIVGRSRGPNRIDLATMWIDGGPPLDLGTAPGHSDSWALAINDANVAVGFSTDREHGRQPARFAEGSVQVFLLPHAEDNGMARGINAAGTIVGQFYDSTLNRYVGGIVEGDSMVDLNLRLRSEDAALYSIANAVGINEAGEIAAQAVDPQTHQPRVVRLEPIIPKAPASSSSP